MLSDGEEKTIKEVNKIVKKVYGEEDQEIFNGIKFLPDGNDFEKYLMASGYDEEVFTAMTEILGDGFLDRYISLKDKTSNGSRQTKEKCETCKQNIYKRSFRDYSSDDGKMQALLDCIHDNKTAYSSIIADVIIENRQEGKIPPMIEELFKEINNDFKILSQEKQVVNI